jgi:hypothetical protein
VAGEWIEATFLVPGICNLPEYLSSLHEFEVLSDALFMASGHREPFFDVHRSAIRLVVPPDSECKPQAPLGEGGEVEHDVLVILEGGHLRGRLSIKSGLRLSDYFRSREGFVVLRDCSFVPHDLSTEEGASRPHRHVVVNTDCVLGVSEPNAQQR